MTTPTVLEYGRTYPGEPERAYDWLLPVPLEQIFARRYGPLPPVRGADIDGDGLWGTAGQTRTIRLADGGTMRESLIQVDRPRWFGYRIDHVTGPMKPLVATLDGRWFVEPAGTGARISWHWTVHPASGWAARVMPVFGRLWQGYARQAFEEIEKGLV